MTPSRMVRELRKIPREAKRPQAVALAKQTLSVAVVQEAKKLSALHVVFSCRGNSLLKPFEAF